MTDPVGGFDRALAAAFAPPGGEPAGLRARPGAGPRLRAAAAHRRSRQVVARLTTATAVLALLLAGGSVLRGGPESGPTGEAIRGAVGPSSPPSGLRPGTFGPLGMRYGPSTLRHPIEVFRVVSTDPAPCRQAAPGAVALGVGAADRICYQLAQPSVLVIRTLTGLQVRQPPAAASAAVEFTLPAAETAVLAAYTGTHVGSRLALVVQQRVWYAPQIGAAIESGDVEIAGSFSADDARALLDTLGPAVLVASATPHS